MLITNEQVGPQAPILGSQKRLLTPTYTSCKTHPMDERSALPLTRRAADAVRGINAQLRETVTRKAKRKAAARNADCVCLAYVESTLAEVIREPGLKLWSIAESMFTRRICIEIFEPTIGDLHEEYYEALSQHGEWRASYVRIRGYWAFWSAVWMQCSCSVLTTLQESLSETRT